MYSKFPEFCDKDKSSMLIASNLFGNRIFKDQTLYEYLIEFLLIFVSEKDEYGNGKMSFHDNIDNTLSYYFYPHMGLRRFIFFNKNQKDKKMQIDSEAYDLLINEMKKNITASNEEDKEKIIDALQDLLKGYSVIVKKRNWCAKNVLPLAPELVFCGAMPNDKIRGGLDIYEDMINVDKSFDFNKRNFLSRGGEVYYLHLLQYLLENDEDKEKLTKALNRMFKECGNKFSLIANFIEKCWRKCLENVPNSSEEKIENKQKLALSYIPKDAYKSVEEYSVKELINYLSCQINPINKIDILAYGIVFQVIRMMNTAVTEYLGIKKANIIIDMRSNKDSVVKKLSSDSYNKLQDLYIESLNKMADYLANESSLSDAEKEKLLDIESRMSELHKAKTNSFDVLKSKGKEMKFIIPVTGGNERFTVSENIVRFLVLSLIEPKKKMTINMFLEKIYEHYGLIIGPVEYRKYADEFDSSLTSSFEENLSLFEQFLKNTGFLRELSDATSVVENPYERLA